jgi:SET domain-containing protein
MRFTVLEHYLFNDKATGGKLLALGYGSLFNHSQHPNVDYRVVVRDSHGGRCIVYSSGHQPIEKGEELCIYYGSNLWFDDADGPDSSSCSDDEPATEKGLPSFLGRMKTHDGDADSING